MSLGQIISSVLRTSLKMWHSLLVLQIGQLYNASGNATLLPSLRSALMGDGQRGFYIGNRGSDTRLAEMLDTHVSDGPIISSSSSPSLLHIVWLSELIGGKNHSIGE